MSDEYNNGVTPDNNGNDPINNDPVEEPKKEEAHTSIPNQNNTYNYTNGNGTYWTNDGQYRSYNQQNQNTNYYNGNNQYNPQNQNPYNQYNHNNGYYQQQPQQQSVKKKNGGKIAAIIGVCAALVVIFTLVAFVVGLMYRRSTSTPTETSKQSEMTIIEPDDTKSTQTNATTKSDPSTDPEAAVSTSNNEKNLSMTEAAARTVDSVVEILTEQTVSGSYMQQYVIKGGGSGVIITEDGYIVTNHHVIEDATEIQVTLRSGTSYKATLVGADSVADLAVIKIDAKGLSPATFGDSDALLVAESVFAIGNPLGRLGGTVTQGIISALARTITIENQEMTLLQTTAAINPGNSGGGLFNLAGECIGIVNAKSYASGIEGLAFAIPSNTAVPVIEDLMKYGYVRSRVKLGVTFVEVSDSYTMRRYGVSELGVYIGNMGETSDAAKAGMKVGDRFVSVNGAKIETYNQIKNLLNSFKAGQTVTFVMARDGKEITIELTFSEYIPN